MYFFKPTSTKSTFYKTTFFKPQPQQQPQYQTHSGTHLKMKHQIFNQTSINYGCDKIQPQPQGRKEGGASRGPGPPLQYIYFFLLGN
jgi:hypothetical protein